MIIYKVRVKKEIGSIIISYLNVMELRIIWYVIMFPIAITGSTLLYYGGIKQL